MDKRTLITTREIEIDNILFSVPVYHTSSRYKIWVRTEHGMMVAYANKVNILNQKLIDSLIVKTYHSMRKYITNRPFFVENNYIYVFGKKRFFTNDARLNEDFNYFYIPSTTKDPINRYKKMFLEYLSLRVVELGQLMNVDLRKWKIRSGLFISYYGICFPTKHQMKFDYRLYAYKKEIIDSVIIHEIAHCFEQNHSKKFYDIVYKFCPNYDELDKFLRKGYFEGEIDKYVFSNN